MLELAILKLFCKDRGNWDKYNKLIKGLNLEKELSLIFNLVSAYYEEYPEHSYIVPQELKAFFSLEYASYKSPEIINKVIDDIFFVEISDSVIVDYVQSVIEKDTATKIINKLLKVVDESEQGLLLSIKDDLAQYESTIKVGTQVNTNFVSDDLLELFAEDERTNHINWRLKCLQEACGPLQEGLVHVYARTNVGKTSWIASEVTNFAAQLNDDEHILYFNNEEAGRKVRYRLYSAMLNKPIEEIKQSYELTQKAIETYRQRGGNRLLLYDNETFSIEDIDRFCQEYNPKIIVVDVADKVTFKGVGNLEGQARLKELYMRYRALSKKYNCTVITSAQASAEAYGKKWIDLIHMDMSRTGKPSELDLSIGIGMSNDDGKETTRYIHVNKNKWTGVHARCTAIINPLTGRYTDV